MAGVTVPHPHAPEGVVGDFPLVPDAEEEQSISVGWVGGAPHQAACSYSLIPIPSSPEDPTVGIPAEGLLMLGHVVEWAELVLVPGGTAAVRGVPSPRPCHPSPHSRGLHQAEALARKSEEMRRP